MEKGGSSSLKSGIFESVKENLLSLEGYFEVLKRKIEIERQKLKK